MSPLERYVTENALSNFFGIAALCAVSTDVLHSKVPIVEIESEMIICICGIDLFFHLQSTHN
jgi:hypothetical protein